MVGCCRLDLFEFQLFSLETVLLLQAELGLEGRDRAGFVLVLP